MEKESLIFVFQQENRSQLTPEAGLETAKLILDCFKHHIDVTQLDEYLDLFFPDDDGLIDFLKDKLGKPTPQDKAFNPTKEHIWLVIKLIVSNNDPEWKRNVSPSCQRLLDIAKLYWKNTNEPSKHQQLALDCIILILENYENEGDRCFETTNLYDVYRDMLVASEASKYQPSVRGKMFHALGLIGSLAGTSGILKKQVAFDQLYRHIINTMKNQVESKDAKLDVTILNGCLKALNKLLQTFSGRINHTNATWDQFYKHLEMIIDPKSSIAADDRDKRYQLKRREFQRTGLELIADNGTLFGKEFFLKYRQWYFDLLTWSKSNNASDSAAGRKAMLTYFQSVVVYVQKDASDIKLEEIQKFVTFFISTFNATLASKNISRAESLVAIKGIGLLAPLTGGDAAEIFGNIIENINKIVIELNNPIADKYNSSLSVIQAYLETASNLILVIDISSADEDDDSNNESLIRFYKQLESVEQLTVQLMTFYPDLSEYLRNTSHHCVLKLVQSLYSKHNKLCVPSIDRVMSSALSQIIASPTQAELDIIYESWAATAKDKKVDAKSARSQLGLRGVKSYVPFWINLTLRHSDSEVVQLVYNQLLSWILSTVEKLDLSITENTTDDLNSIGDIFSVMKPNNHKDFQLFINLVDFLQIFLSKTEKSLFNSCMNQYVSTIVELTQKNPMVSGFYKLLTSAFDVIRAMGYFQDIDSEERKIVFNKCIFLMKSLTSKIHEFRDDLLASLLELWLSSPDEMILANDYNWSSTLTTIFTLGRVNLHLANTCVDAFQRWTMTSAFPRQVIEDLVKSLFPIWQSYFVSEGKPLEFLKQSGLSKTKTSKKPTSSMKITLTREEKDRKQYMQEVNEVTLLKVQTKLLSVIGSFAHVLDPETISPDDFVLSAGNEILKYTIPFNDTKPDVYIDNLIPRILQLCENSADRQIRAAACEFLHTVVLYFLGYSLRESCSDQHIGLFSKMFKTILKLSGDSDFLVRQLFNPLASQCIHWFTKPKNDYAKFVLQAIVDGLVQMEDMQLRDFSADSFSEYFKWSLKYDNKPQAREVIKFIVALSTHANMHYRLGAAIGFNGIYKDFREDMGLWNEYTFVLLTSFLNSLAVSSSYDDNSVIIKTTKMSIQHLEKIIVKKKDNFNNKIQGRKPPTGFTPEKIYLDDLGNWFILQIGSAVSRICREENIRLLKIILPLIRKHDGTLKTFLSKSTLNLTDESELIRLAEQTKQRLKIDSSVKDLAAFVDASSDFYVLLIANEFIISRAVFSNEQSAFISSLDKLLSFSSSKFKNSENENENIDDDKDFWSTCCRICKRFPVLKQFLDDTVVSRFMEFTILVAKFVVDFEEDDIIDSLMTTCLSLPSNLGAIRSLQTLVTDLTTEEESQQIEINGTLERIKFLRLIRIAAEKSVFQLINKDEETVNFQTISQSLWASIQNKLFSVNNLRQTESNEIRNKYVVDELQEILMLCIALGLGSYLIVDATFDSTNVHILNSTSSTIVITTKGDIFQKYLHRALLHCEDVMKFAECAKKIKIVQLGEFIERTIRIVTGNKSLKAKFGRKCLENIEEIWNSIAVNCDTLLVAKILSGLANINHQYCRNSEELAKWWCGKEAMGAENLNFQEKSEYIGFLSLFAQSQNSKIVDSVISTVLNIATEKIDVLNMTWNENERALTKFVSQILAAFERNPLQRKLLKPLLVAITKISSLTDEVGNSSSKAVILDDVYSRMQNIVKNINNDTNASEHVSHILDLVNSSEDCQINLAAINCIRPSIQAMTINGAKMFYKNAIVLLMSIIKNEEPFQTLPLESWNLRIMALNALSMLPKKCGPKFVDVMSKEYQAHQEKNPAAAQQKATNILQDLASFLKRVKESSVLSQRDFKYKSTALQCQIAGYCTTAICLLATNKPLRILEGMLIHEDPDKNLNLWNNLIEISENIEFPVLLEDGSNTEISDSDTTPITAPDTAADTEKLASTTYNQRMKARINLAASSLAGEATVFDFTIGLPTANDATFYHGVFDSSKISPTDSNTPNATSSQAKRGLKFKCETFSNESIFTFVQTLKRLAKLSTLNETPKWPGSLKAVLQGKHHQNVKVFILVGFLNCQAEMKRFASVFKDTIIRFIMTGGRWKEKFNYFIKDLLIMLLSWGEDGIPSESLKNDAIQFIIRSIIDQNGSHNRNDLLQNNLGILETVLEKWQIKEANNIPYNVMDGDLKLKLAIYRILLQKNIQPQDTYRDILREFCKHLKNSSKTIYSDAAENIGLLLQQLGHLGQQTSSVEYVNKKIQEEVASRSTPVLTMLRQIHKHWPSIILQFKSTLYTLLSSSTVLQSEVLELLGNCLSQELIVTQEAAGTQNDSGNVVVAFFSELEGRRIFHNPCSVLTDAQTGIGILESLLKHTTQFQSMMTLVEWLNILQLENDDNEDLRVRYYKCIYKIYINIKSTINPNRYVEVSRSIERLFIVLSSSPSSDEKRNENHGESEIDEIIKDFWTTCLRDQNNSVDFVLRLMELLAEQSNALEILVEILIKRCATLPEFQKFIPNCDKPLEDCLFTNYAVDTSWRASRASFVPLFAESLSSQQNVSQMPEAIQATLQRQRQSFSTFGVNMLRATLSTLRHGHQGQFSPTVDMSNDFEEMDVGDFDYLNPPTDDGNRNHEEGNNDDPPQNELGGLSRRFYARSAAGNTDFFINRQLDKNLNRMNLSKEKLHAKRNNVKLVRKYRVGELPDILMKNCDFLFALKNLAQRDWDFGKMFLVNLLSTMFNESDENGRNKISSSIEDLVKNHSTSISSTFASAIIETCIKSNLLISADLVAKTCVYHGLYELGILMLERHVSNIGVNSDDTTSPSNKRRRMDEAGEVTIYLRIAELYQDLEECDVLKNIFSIIATLSTNHSYNDVYNKTYSALSLELAGKLDDADEKYKQLFLKHNSTEAAAVNPAFQQFIQDAYFQSLSRLSEWKQLLQHGIQTLETSDQIDLSLISLPTKELVVFAGLHTSLDDSSTDDGEDAMETSDNEMMSTFHFFLLENPLVGELQCYPEKALHLLSADFESNGPKCSLILEKAWNAGVGAFKMFSKLSKPQKKKQLLRLQLGAVLEDVLNMQKLLDAQDAGNKCVGFISKFEKLFNSRVAPFLTAESVVSSRSHFILKMLDHPTLEEKQLLKDRIKLLDFRQHLWVASLGLRDGNFPVADKYIAKYKYRQLEEDPILQLHLNEWRPIYVQYLSAFRNHSTDINEWLKTWSNTWKKINKSTKELREAVSLQSDLLHCLIHATSSPLGEQKISAIGIQSVTKVLGNSSSIKDATKTACKRLLSSLENYETETIENSTEASRKIYFLLESMSETFPDEFSFANNEIVILMLKCLIQSMKSDNAEGLLLFPRVLQLLEKFSGNEQVENTFRDFVKVIPSWKFLPWTDQILSFYESANEMKSVLDPIVKAVVKDFPNSLMLQYPHILPSVSSVHLQYAKSLKALVLPSILHKDALDEIISWMSKGDLASAGTGASKLKNTLQEICDEEEIFGSRHRLYANEMIDSITELMDELQSLEEISSSQPSGIETKEKISRLASTSKMKIMNINESHNRQIFPIISDNSKAKVVNIGEFSPWLANFHQFNVNDVIEVPGLYESLSNPNVQLHANIVSFEPTVQVYNSITKPIRFTVLANNGKKKSFLAKHGDDLRQDRRIQQLIKVANTLFLEDSKTRERKISLVSYSVLPLNELFGIIEWINKTVDLKSLILSRQELLKQRHDTSTSHEEWIFRTSNIAKKSTDKPKEQYLFYYQSAKNAKPQEAVQHFDSLAGKLSNTLLMCHLQERSKSFEQYFKVRQSLIRSQASMGMVHWLLGIGDRHLENSLVTLESGQMVGIDFGRAFGTSNTIQVIPEMVPFRLTPQLQNLMMPYGHKGLFRETMRITWECLLKSSDIVKFILKTVVDEKSVNWLKKRKNQKQLITLGNTSKLDDAKSTQLEIISQKLQGKNPVNILIQELQSHVQRNIVDGYTNVVKNGRESMAELDTIMTPEEVVDCLLDLATDKNILCRLFVGWNSWI